MSYSIEDLEAGIASGALAFGKSPAALAARMAKIAEKYRSVLEAHTASSTRGAVLRALTETLERPDVKLEGAIRILPDEAFHALVGQHPISSYAHSIGSEASTAPWLMNSNKITVATMKARQARRSTPHSSKFQLSQLKIYPGMDADEWQFEREKLLRLARESPHDLRQIVQKTVAEITRAFQLDGQKGGRNLKVVDGIAPNPDWLLCNMVLDNLWPVSKGKIHARKMEPLRTIINAVVAYATEDRKVKKGRGGSSAESDEEDSDNGLLFDANFLSAVITLRSQISLLNQTIKFIEPRLLALADPEKYPLPSRRSRSERLYRRLFYPLLDWRRELERRLEFGDYRSYSKSVRRPTGPALPTPDMPKTNKQMSGARIAIRLMHAAGTLAKPRRQASARNSTP